jgi:tetratricopeptide (TPR) repeat protein
VRTFRQLIFVLFLLFCGSVVAQVSEGAGKPTETPAKSLELGIEKYKKRDYVAAIEFFSKAIASDSMFINAYIYRGIAKDAQDNFAGALTDFNKARKLDSNDVYIYVERSQTFLNLGELEAAAKDFRKIIELNPNSQDASDAYYYLARINFKQKKYEPAINFYTRVLKFRPDDPEVMFLRGECKFMLGDYRGAIKDFDLSLTKDDDNELAYAKRGEAKLFLEDKKGACEDFAKAKRNGYKEAAELISKNCK